MSLMLPELLGPASRSGPPGDPAAARAAAQRFTATQEALRIRQASIEGVISGVVPADWVGQAANSFRSDAQSLLAGFPTAIDACQRAAGALNRYAAELEDAQARAATALGALADLDTRADRLNATDTTGLTGAEADRLRGLQAQEIQAEASNLQGQLAAAQAQADEAAQRLRGELESITALAGRSIRSFLDWLQGFKTATDPIALVAALRDFRVGLGAFALVPGVAPVAESYLRVVGPVRAAETLNNKEFGLVKRAEWLWRYMHGVPRGPSQLRTFADGIADVFGRGRQSVGAAAVVASALGTAFRPVSVVAGKVLGPIGALTDARTLLQGSELEGGKESVDRVMAGAGLVGGTAGTLAAFGAISLTPPGLVAVATIGAVTAAWSIGKWAYSERESIAEFMVDRWNDASELQEGVNKALPSPCPTLARRSARHLRPLGMR